MHNKKTALTPIVVLYVLVALVAAAIAAAANALRRQSAADQRQDTVVKITVHANQITKTQLEMPARETDVKVVNRVGPDADIDFVAKDEAGNEIARETVVVGSNRKERIS